MGLQSDQENDTNQNLANGAETTRRVPDNRRQRWEGGAKSAGNLAEEMLMNTEESVMANFDFLSRENDMDDEDEVMADETDDGFSPSQIVKKADLGGLGVDTDTEDVLKEFNFLTQAEVCSQFHPTMKSALINCPQGGDVVDKAAEWSGGGEWGVARTEGGAGAGAQPQTEQSNLALGELEQLTITNDNDLNYDQVNAGGHMVLTFNEYLTRNCSDVIKGGISQNLVS